jgi:hypothetical protein
VDDCGAFKQALVIIVAVVVTVAVTAALGPAGTGMMSSWAAGAIGAAAGSVASQGVAMAVGLQDSFSWKSVGLAALGGAIGGAINANTSAFKSFESAAGVARAITSNVLTQGIGVMTGLQEKFSWQSVAISGAAAAISPSIQKGFSESAFAKDFLGGADSLATKTAANFLTGTTTQIIRMAVYGQGKLDFASLAADAFGNALGDAVVQSVRRSQLPDSFQGLSTQQKDDALALADRLGWSARDPRLAGVGMEFVTGKVMMNAQERQSVTTSWLAERGLNAAQRAEVLERMRNGGELDEVLDGSPEPEPTPLPPGTSVIHLGRVTVTASDRPTVLGARTIDGMAVSTGDFVKTVGQLLDDRPYLKVGIEALQLASAPLGYFAGKAIEHSPIGDAANDLLASATTAIAGSFADVGYNASDSTSAGVGIMAVGGLALGWGASRVTGFVASRLPSMNEAVASTLARRRVELNFERDGGIDPHVVDPRVLAQGRLGQMQQQFTPLMAKSDAHFLTKHGPQTSLADQYERATVGWPNRNGKLVPADASRFFNPEDMEDAIRLAMAQYSGNPDVPVVVPMGKPIGEGFVKVGPNNPGPRPEYRQSNAVRVIFDQSGLPKTAYPDIVRNGVVLPPPKF